jgi:ankyrin repeat protein
MKNKITDILIENILAGDARKSLASTVPWQRLNEVGSQGRTPLMIAVVKGDIDVVQL